ncbi:MAG: efflux RND transporter permease subunit [Bdellovibrionota bacterium]
MWLVKLSINRPILMSMIELFIIVLGIFGFIKIGVDLYPEVDPPVITITTEYSGAGPEEIELLVTKKIEDEVNQIGGIDRIVSTTKENISQVVIEFHLYIDAQIALTEVREKVSRIRSKLPKDIEEPLVQRLDFADRPILQLALKNANDKQITSEVMLREFADDTLKQKIQKIDGVGQIDIFGGAEREIAVELERKKLLLWQETPTSVATSIQQANQNVPAGSIKEEPMSRSLRIMGEYESVNEIPDTIVKTLPSGRVLHIRDLGQVKDSLKERESFARLNGKPIILLEVKRQSGTNTVKVADNVKKEVKHINAEFSRLYNLEVLPIYDGAKKIRMSLYDVIESLVIAAALAFIVVYLFLGSMQSTFITGIALPTTIIAAFFALYSFGYTLNIMTLLGLTLCVGLILDDAIVVRENIWKKIEEGSSPKDAAFFGTQQVYTAVIATSLTILATFIPVTMIPGVVGRFFQSFAITVCLAVIVSTFDALTMAPMLSAYLVRPSLLQKKNQPNKLIALCEKFGEYFSKFYKIILIACLDRPRRTLSISFLVFIFSLYLVKFVGFTFLPNSESGEIDIIAEAPPGTTINESNRISKEFERKIANLNGVSHYSSRVGNDLGEPNFINSYIQLIPFEQRSKSTSEFKDLLRKELSNIVKEKGLILTVRDAGGGAAGNKPVSLAIQGPDNSKLLDISNEIIAKSNGLIPEVIGFETNLRPGRSEVKYQIDTKRTAAFGLSTQQVGKTIRGMYEGELASYYRDKGNEYDVRVRLRAEDRLGLASLADFSIPNDRGDSIPLQAVTRKFSDHSPTKIVRIDQQRSSLLEGDLQEGAPLGSAISKLTDLVQPLLPQGYTMKFQGQAESLRDLGIGAITALLLGGLFIYMIMASLYESLIIPFSILLTLPLAIVGAIAALLVARTHLDVYSVIGIILLMGLVTKNAILLVDYVEQLRASGIDRRQALIEGGLRRLRPIMMTTVAMIVGMAPIAFGYGELNKSRAGMGIAAVGGLISSTMLSLVVIPCAYVFLDRFRHWSKNLIQKHW